VSDLLSAKLAPNLNVFDYLYSAVLTDLGLDCSVRFAFCKTIAPNWNVFVFSCVGGFRFGLQCQV
jgi:hypothetical protein